MARTQGLGHIHAGGFVAAFSDRMQALDRRILPFFAGLADQ
jgi:hypothetical protein